MPQSELNSSYPAFFDDYPYFQDGQFMMESVQPQLVESFLHRSKHPKELYWADNSSLIHGFPLDWDSDFFEASMARLQHFWFSKSQAAGVLWEYYDQWIQDHKIKHVSCRINEEAQDIFNSLLAKGFEPVSGKHLTRFSTSNLGVAIPADGLRFEQPSSADAATLVGLAANNFKENRFLKDDFFEPAKATALYERWIENEVLKAPENVTKVLKGDEIVGFVIAQKFGPGADRKFGVIDLIAVAPSQQGQGLGKRILHHALQNLKTQGTTIIFANVVSTNLSSLRMFQSAGFEVYATLLELRHVIKP